MDKKKDKTIAVTKISDKLISIKIVSMIGKWSQCLYSINQIVGVSELSQIANWLEINSQGKLIKPQAQAQNNNSYVT